MDFITKTALQIQHCLPHLSKDICEVVSMTLLSTAIGNRYQFDSDEGMFLNIASIGIGTSRVGKSRLIDNFINKTISIVDDELILPTSGSMEAFVDTLADKDRQEGIFIRDEISDFFKQKNYAQTNIELLAQLLSNSEYYRKTKGGGIKRIYRGNTVSMFGMATELLLDKKVLDDSVFTQGFANRVLWYTIKSNYSFTKESMLTPTLINQYIQQRTSAIWQLDQPLVAFLHQLQSSNTSGVPIKLLMTKDARTMFWTEYIRYTQAKSTNEPNKYLSNYYVGVGGNLAKLAGIKAISRHYDTFYTNTYSKQLKSFTNDNWQSTTAGLTDFANDVIVEVEDIEWAMMKCEQFIDHFKNVMRMRLSANVLQAPIERDDEVIETALHYATIAAADDGKITVRAYKTAGNIGQSKAGQYMRMLKDRDLVEKRNGYYYLINQRN